jgi:hypothetical protein
VYKSFGCIIRIIFSTYHPIFPNRFQYPRIRRFVVRIRTGIFHDLGRFCREYNCEKYSLHIWVQVLDPNSSADCWDHYVGGAMRFRCFTRKTKLAWVGTSIYYCPFGDNWGRQAGRDFLTCTFFVMKKTLTAISRRVCFPSARVQFVGPSGDEGPGTTFSPT